MKNQVIGPFLVLEVTQKGGSFFSASISAEDLVSVSYSDVRRLVGEDREVERYLGIQRPLNKDRVREIREYILSPDPTFPTAVILAIEERCVDFDPDTRMMTLRPYLAQEEGDVEIPLPRIAKILDGQHRLAGFLDEGTGQYDIGGKPFDINVSIFVGADLSVQAQIFATVNLAQTKVSRSLVYELEDLSKARSPFKTCHNIAVALDGLKSSPFYGRIKRLGVVTPGRTSETITQAAFVESLANLISTNPQADRNDLLDGRAPKRTYGSDALRTPFRDIFLIGEDDSDFDIADNVDNYFRAVRAQWPRAWADTSRKSGILPKTNAFRAFMRHLKDVYPVLANFHGRIVPVAAYAEVLDSVKLADTDLTSRNFKPGSSGESAFYKVLSGQAEPEELFEQMELPLDEA